MLLSTQDEHLKCVHLVLQLHKSVQNCTLYSVKVAEQLFSSSSLARAVIVTCATVIQIRHASVDRLLDRLTDLRFLSIDFLNTFLLTYRVFTTGRTVMEALKRVYHNPECGYGDSMSHLTCR